MTARGIGSATNSAGMSLALKVYRSRPITALITYSSTSLYSCNGVMVVQPRSGASAEWW